LLLLLAWLLGVQEVGEFELKASGPEDLPDHEEIRDDGQGLAVAIQVFADAMALHGDDAAQVCGLKVLDDVDDDFEQVAAITAVLREPSLVGEVEADAVEEVEDAF
jgi:hypothetical protein